MERNLARFNRNHLSFCKKVRLISWYVFSRLFFERFWFPPSLRPIVLRFFGSKVAQNVHIRSEVRVYFPWNLAIGENSWIGEKAIFINHEFVVVASNVCISQNALVSSGGHDLKSPTLEYKHGCIHIDRGAWVCIGSTILPGSVVGENSIVSAGEVFSGQLEANHIFRGGIPHAIRY